MKNLSDKAKAFLSKNPTLIGTVAGHRFYEHPDLGDESPLIEITPAGKVRRSEFWEVPDLWDLGYCHDENIYGSASIEQSIRESKETGR